MAENISTPEQTAEEKACTSHLAGAVAAAAEEAAAEEVLPNVPDLKLPKTLKDAHAMLLEMQAAPAKSATESKTKSAQLEKLREHIFNLSQGPTAKPISAKSHVELSASSSDHAEEIHLTLLSRTDSIVAKRLAEDAATIATLKKQIATLKK
jgi:hypothetical protein